MLTGLGAAELAAKIAAREVSSREVVEAHIRRIEAVNPFLRAVVVNRFDQALDEARTADEALSRGAPAGPLHGVPITVKESFHLAGTPSTAGIDDWKGNIPREDGPLVASLRRAGAIVVAKTNVAQLLWFVESSNPVYGRTNNPWQLDRTPGGSTGGEAAIIAAGGSPLGLGTDIGGSIRCPAHFCGIHGFKPTSGRLSIAGTVDGKIAPGMEAVIDQPGPLARRVADLALAMELLTQPGKDPLDPAVPPVAWTAAPPAPVEKMRIALCLDNGYFRPSPALQRVVREAGEALCARGATVEEWIPPDAESAYQWVTGIFTADGGAGLRRALGRSRRDPIIRQLLLGARMPGPLRAIVSALFTLGGQKRLAGIVRASGAISTDTYWKVCAARAAHRDRFLAALDAGRYDAILSPPYGLAAIRHGTCLDVAPAQSYCAHYNLLGLPAGVVAAGRVRPGEESDRPPSRERIERVARASEAGSAGLPVGVQVAARPWREDVVLSVMRALEEHFQIQPDYPLTALPSCGA